MAEFVTSESSGAWTVSASGEVDIATVNGLLESARACLAAGAEKLVVDLSAVTFIDSSGLGALVRIRNEARRDGVPVVLREVPSTVERLLEVTGLVDAFPAGEDD